MEESQETEAVTASQKFISAIECGEIVWFDGVMSPQTVGLVRALSAEGVDMTTWWSMTPQDWHCPACGRHKREIVRLNAKGELMCRLVDHHDHMRDLLVERFEEISTSMNDVVADQLAERFAARSASMVACYDNTVICDDCNAADPKAKRMIGAHKRFSFSPSEIRQFVVARPNQPHEVNERIARSVWEAARETFNLRLKIVDRIAEIAATNRHWYQETRPADRSEKIRRTAYSMVLSYGAFEAFEKPCGAKKTSPPRSNDEWRTKLYPRAKRAPTKSEVDHVAKVSYAAPWSSVPDDWHCPTCKRNKVAVIRASNQSKWSFSLATAWYRDASAKKAIREHTLCGDCGWTAQKLGKEASTLAAIDTGRYACLVELGEIRRVVIASSHSRHSYNHVEADKVVGKIADRLRAEHHSISEVMGTGGYVGTDASKSA